MFDVVTYGSATIDVFLNTDDRLFGKQKNGKITIPFGSKVLVKEIDFHAGGGGTNAAVAMSNMGLKTSFLGNISASFQAQFILEHLKLSKVDLSLLIRKGHMSGYSAILDAKGRDRTILAHKGCNDKILWKDVNVKKLKTRWVYMTSTMGESFETAKKLAAWTEKEQVGLMFNPSSYLVRKGIRFLKPILKHTDILVFNKEEAELLFGKGTMKQLLKKCVALGPDIVIITDGRKGASATDGDSVFTIRPCPTKVKETTGAGDAFGAGFLSGFLHKGEVEYALKIAQVNAESVISHYGAHNGLLSWNKARAHVKKKSCYVEIKNL